MTTSIGATSVTTGAIDGARTATRKEATADPSRRRDPFRTPTIADQYSGLLVDLTPGQRRGLIAKLSVGYYDGWRPTRAELAAHIHDEFGTVPGVDDVSLTRSPGACSVTDAGRTAAENRCRRGFVSRPES